MNKLKKFILVCYEGNTDLAYISEAYRYRYKQRYNNVILLSYCFNGKENSCSESTIRRVKKTVSENGKTNCLGVVYCLDSDNYINNPEDCRRNDRIERVCRENKFHLVWMNRNIEEVFWKSKPSDKKKDLSLAFARRKEIDSDVLMHEDKKVGYSNLYCVFDRIFLESVGK